MVINFFLVFGVLVVISGFSIYIGYRKGRLSEKFKGKSRLFALSLSLIAAGTVSVAVGLIQLYTK